MDFRLFLRLRPILLLVISICAQVASSQSGDSWHKVLQNGSGTVQFYWFPSNIMVDQSIDVMDGVEHEMCEDFIRFLREKYNVEIQAKWNRTANFSQVMDIVTQGRGGTFGVSSISITREREEVFNFSPAFFPDISVLVSSGNLPIIRTDEDFKETFDGLTAVTIENTTLEQGLLRLKDSLKIDFDIQYVDNGGAIIEKIEKMENAFGYSDLPNFLSAVPRSPNIKRQVFYPLKLEGLGMIYPLASDWRKPIEEYFESDRYYKIREELIDKYMGQNVNDLIERISKSAEIGPFEEIAILTEEVELRYEEILDATIQAQKDKDLRNALIAGVILVIFLASILVIRSTIRHKAAEAIEEKQALIEERNQKLEDLNREKNNLIKVLAHDLRAPIAQILGFSRLMMDNEKMPPEEKEMIGYMAQASERLRQMIGKILDVDAIESGKMNIKMETVALSDIFSSVQKDFKEHAAKKLITIEDISENTSFKVKADRVYLIQIVENLVSNALKFSMPGTSINFDTEDEGDRVVISITDQGPGFTPEDEQKIFKKYQRLSAQSTGGEPSTGLGLSIVKSFTEMMNGAVSYRTILGKGTTFYIRLAKA